MPFAAVAFELHFIFKSLWNHNLFYMYGALILIAIVLLILVAQVTVIYIYLFLCHEVFPAV